LVPDGYRPGTFWAPAISVTQLVCGPMLALGLFTRLAAFPIVIFLVVSNYERWRVGGYFWNKTGLEYTLMWTVAALYFLVHGGGAISGDHLLARREFLPPMRWDAAAPFVSIPTTPQQPPWP